MLTEIMYRRSQDLSPLIHPYCVKQALCDVNPEDAHLWFHWTRLLWRYGWHRTPKSLWLTEVDPHRGGSISLLPDSRIELKMIRLLVHNPMVAVRALKGG